MIGAEQLERLAKKHLGESVEGSATVYLLNMALTRLTTAFLIVILLLEWAIILWFITLRASNVGQNSIGPLATIVALIGTTYITLKYPLGMNLARFLGSKLLSLISRVSLSFTRALAASRPSVLIVTATKVGRFSERVSENMESSYSMDWAGNRSELSVTQVGSKTFTLQNHLGQDFMFGLVSSYTSPDEFAKLIQMLGGQRPISKRQIPKRTIQKMQQAGGINALAKALDYPDPRVKELSIKIFNNSNQDPEATIKLIEMLNSGASSETILSELG